MNRTEKRLWPFGPRTSLVSAALLLPAFLVLAAVLRAYWNWPAPQSENLVLIGALILSLLPILLALVDAIMDRGAVIEYGGVKIDFSRRQEILEQAGLTVPANIGVPGQAVTDSSTTQILDALRQATASDVVLIDLADGHAGGKRDCWFFLQAPRGSASQIL